MFLDKRVVAVCFPRSGSHFLTNCLVSYFGDSLKYLEPYANTSNFPKPRFGSHFIGARYLNFKYFCKRGAEGRADVTRAYSFDEANFIRFHDFSSFPKRSLYMSEDGVTIERKYCLGNVTNQDNTCYLILIRHPIETIQSYYELLVHASGLPDSLESWNSFQEHALEYWKSFVDKWIINPNDHLVKNKLVVLYEDIINNTEMVLSRVVSCFDYKNLEQGRIRKIAKLRYVSTRRISDFKYFDAQSCINIQDQLYDAYLKPIGITPYVNFSNSVSSCRSRFVEKVISKTMSW